jgi:hypothetical protein
MELEVLHTCMQINISQSKPDFILAGYVRNQHTRINAQNFAKINLGDPKLIKSLEVWVSRMAKLSPWLLLLNLLA